ncbi:MAG: NfeD family protein [Gammaproteobacteria bacterium]|nr:NfeD family protein [Gammaproteobacteria bacterium]
MSAMGPLVFWHWLLLGIGLMIAETVFPGSFLLWFGIGAVITGALTWLIPTLDWQVQLLFFAIVSMASIILWRRHRAANPEITSHPNLNQRGLQIVARRFTLDEPIVNGVGRLHVDDTMWRVEGEDMPAGTAVIVNGVEGTVLRVNRAA